MNEKVKAVNKSAEALRSPLKFGKLALFTLVRALKHAEFRPLRPQGLRDADFFKAPGLLIGGIRLCSDRVLNFALLKLWASV
jgi:hypothetical protein